MRYVLLDIDDIVMLEFYEEKRLSVLGKALKGYFPTLFHLPKHLST